MRAVLPDWVPRQELSRPSAETISRLSNRRQTLTYAGSGAVIPVVYGEQVVSGPVIAGPVVSGNNVILAVALSVGPIGGVLDVRSGETIGNINSSGQGSVSGATVWVYDGTQTSHNTILSGAIPGFDDVFRGIAYAVIRSSDINVATTLAFRVSGRLNGNENPVRHLRDFVMNSDFGLDMSQPLGYIEARDLADSLYSGLPRSRTGLTIQDPLTAEDALTLLAEYAEVLWSYEGDRVRIVPDAPVDTIHPISPDDMIEGSLSMTTVGLEDIPTQVRIEFTDRADPEWASRPAVAEAPEHAMHGMPTSPSSVPLPGVYNRIEAERRAHQRLRRLQAPGRVEWRMFAPGMQYQAGDVVRLPDMRGLQSVSVRLTAQPEMTSPSQYQMRGELYSRSHYPESAEGALVPVGAIVPYFGSLPAGFEAWNPGNRFLVGDAVGGQNLPASGSNASQNTPGIYPATGMGAHRARDAVGESALLPYSSPSSDGPLMYLPNLDERHGYHNHSISVSANAARSRTPEERLRWAKSTGSSPLLPSNTAVLSDREILSATMQAALDAVGRYLSAGDTPTSRSNRNISGTTGGRGNHFHGPSVRAEQGRQSTTILVASGGHNHSWSGSVEVKLRSRKMALYIASESTLVPKGGVVGWEGSGIPPGWALCDGSNGTVDLRGFFIELSAPDDAGEIASEVSNTRVRYSTATITWAHNHYSNVSGVYLSRQTIPLGHQQLSVPHAHNRTYDQYIEMGEILPARRTLRFIQYIGDE